MLETPEEVDRLQQLLDRSADAAGPHLRGIITENRRLSAVQVCQLMQVHGRAELFDINDPARGELRQAMLNHYLPLQGPDFETWLDQADAVGARIIAEKMFTFSSAQP